MNDPMLDRLNQMAARRRVIVALMLACGGGGWLHASSAVAQESKPTPTTARPLRVVASISILADMTKQLAGASADVSSLVGPNADAHTYSPSPADVRRLAQADLVVVNGLRLEGWLERLIAASGYHGPVVVATKGLVPMQLAGAPDPHAWQSLRNARIYIQNIAVALKTASPSSAADIEARTVAYLGQIESLDAQARARFGAIPQEQRRVITSHDAFGYLGAAYGIEFISPQGRSTDSEASAADVARVIRQLKEQRVKALFIENITDPRLVDRIAKEAGVKSGGELYSDALSPPGTAADTYLKMYAFNVDALANAMQGK
jgi:zinc/manganese transport system substrate-binding protein